VAAGGAQRQLERGEPAREGAGDRLLYLPSGRLIRVLDLGYSAVLADLIYLWSVQYYGNYPGGVRYDYLMQFYDKVITELDPRFRDAYLLGSLILSVEARRPQEAIQLLDKGARANPDDWVLPFEAGFVAYDEMHDYRLAADYFAEAMRRPGVLPVVSRFHAEMFHRAGDTATSLRNWIEILDTAKDDEVRRIAARHVRELSIENDLEHLRRALGAYHERHGAYPPDLRRLVTDGLLRAVPLDPDGRPYRYAAATGDVAAPARAGAPRGSR
jgi:tetratricopeptide (TPR) repeat protein